MSIKMPPKNINHPKEILTESFIQKGSLKNDDYVSTRVKKKPIMLRVDPHILEKIDQASKKRGLTRSAWICYALSCSLEEENH